MKKLFAYFCAVLMSVVFAFSFAACNDNSVHTHTYSEVWTYDTTDHWHEPTCTDGAEVSEKAEHTFDGGTVTVAATVESEGRLTYTCTVCGYKKVETIDRLTPYLDGAESLVTGSYGMVFSNFEFADKKQGYSLALDTLTVGYDDNGSLYGFGSGTFTSSKNEEYSADVVLDESGVYVYGTCGDDNFYASLPVDTAVSIAKSQIEALMATENAEKVNTLIPVFTDWFENDFLPLFSSIDIEEVDVTDSDVNAAIQKVADSLFVENEGTYSLDFKLLKTANTYLYENKISSILGANTYALIKMVVPVLIDENVASVVALIEKSGVTVDQIVESVDNLLASAAEATDEEPTTLKQILISHGVEIGDMTISEWLASEKVSKYSVGDLLSAVLSYFGKDMTAAEIKTLATSTIDTVGKMTVYDVVGMFVSDFDKEEAYNSINAVIDELAEKSYVTFTVDESGNVSKVDVAIILDEVVDVEFSYIRDQAVNPDDESVKEDVTKALESIVLTNESVVEQSDFVFTFDANGNLEGLVYVDGDNNPKAVSINLSTSLVVVMPYDTDVVKVYFVPEGNDVVVLSFTYNTSTNKAVLWSVENFEIGDVQSENTVDESNAYEADI